MSDEQYKLGIDIQKTGSGGTEAIQELDQLKAKAGEVDGAMQDIRPPKFDTGALVRGTDEANVKLQSMRETLGGVNAAAHGSLVGLAKATEGIAKIAGVSDEGLKALHSLTGALGAAGVGAGIGTAIGKAIYDNIITPIWDAHDAAVKLNDPLRIAYEETKKANRALIDLNGVKLANIKAEADRLTEALKIAAKETDNLRVAAESLDRVNQDLASAQIRNAEALGKITKEDAARRLAEIGFMREANALVVARGEAEKKLQEIIATMPAGSPAVHAQELVVASFETQLETLKINRDTAVIEIQKAGEEAGKALGKAGDFVATGGELLSNSAEGAGTKVKAGADKAAADHKDAGSTLSVAIQAAAQAAGAAAAESARSMGASVEQCAAIAASAAKKAAEILANVTPGGNPLEGRTSSGGRVVGSVPVGDSTILRYAAPNNWGGDGKGTWSQRNSVVQDDAGDISRLTSMSGGRMGGSSSVGEQISIVEAEIRKYQRALNGASGEEYRWLASAISRMTASVAKANRERQEAITRVTAQVNNNRW